MCFECHVKTKERRQFRKQERVSTDYKERKESYKTQKGREREIQSAELQ